jgi:fumarylpyruvate hydrolase
VRSNYYHSRICFPSVAAGDLPLHGSVKRVPVRRIYCVGRNCAEHLREMGGDERELPFFFQKPMDAIVQDGSVVTYPSVTTDFQHEIELVLCIGTEGANIPAEGAGQYGHAAGVGIDLTRRDVQIQVRKTGRPWEIGKSFDCSAPCGALRPLTNSMPPKSGRIELRLNGQTRQQSDLGLMIWSSDEIMSKLSEQYRLFPGDLIFTGTPAGVEPMQRGDIAPQPSKVSPRSKSGSGPDGPAQLQVSFLLVAP